MKIQIANKDIKIFKIVCPYFINYIYTTPVRGTKIKLNKLYKSILEDKNIHEKWAFDITGIHASLEVNGQIHAGICLYPNKQYILLEGIIPKGSKYIIVDNNNIVSDHIIYIKEIEKFQIRKMTSDRVFKINNNYYLV